MTCGRKNGRLDLRCTSRQNQMSHSAIDRALAYFYDSLSNFQTIHDQCTLWW